MKSQREHLRVMWVSKSHVTKTGKGIIENPSDGRDHSDPHTCRLFQWVTSSRQNTLVLFVT